MMNEPQNVKDRQISKIIEITNELKTQIANEPQILKQYQINDDTQILKEHPISNQIQITNEP